MANKKQLDYGYEVKVFIALTCQRFVFSRTVFSLVHTLKEMDVDYDFYMEMGCDIASSRNRVIQAAKDAKATHVLFVDYDMFFPPKAIKLLLRRNKDIIGATYNFRNDPPRSTAVPVTEASTTEPFKVNALGAGLLLIKMSVFDKMKMPYFMFGHNERGEIIFGEDTYFCQMAIKEGFDVWADPTLDVKHIGEKLF